MLRRRRRTPQACRRRASQLHTARSDEVRQGFYISHQGSSLLCACMSTMCQVTAAKLTSAGGWLLGGGEDRELAGGQIQGGGGCGDIGSWKE